MLQDQYSFVLSDLRNARSEEVYYWLTWFILDGVKGNGNLHLGSCFYIISCGLLRHFRKELKRYDLNIFAKDEPQFAPSWKAFDSRMKGMTTAGIGLKDKLSGPIHDR